MPARKPKRKIDHSKDYVMSDTAYFKVGYKPKRRTRKAPKAYWRRRPYDPGYGMKNVGKEE